MIVVAGTARLAPSHRAATVALGSDMAAKSAAEPGCNQYRFAIDVDDPNVVHLFEEWVDQEALDAHFATPHFAEFGAALLGALDGEAVITRYVVESSGPLFG